MKLVTSLLSNIFMTAFSECGYDEALGQVVVSNRLDLCQFQCNGALSGAKQYRKSPLLIAKEVAAHIPENEMIGSLEVVAPGFINISLKDEFLMKYVQELYFDKYMGIPQADKEETIVLDYGNPNVAKPPSCRTSAFCNHRRSSQTYHNRNRQKSCWRRALGGLGIADGLGSRRT